MMCAALSLSSFFDLLSFLLHSYTGKEILSIILRNRHYSTVASGLRLCDYKIVLLWLLGTVSGSGMGVGVCTVDHRASGPAGTELILESG